MAFRRRWQKRRSRRPRSRRATRPTTEQGSGRWERSFFNFLVDQPISVGGGATTNDAVQLVTGSALISPATTAGTQALAIARLLQQPLKGYDVLAVTYDLDCFLDSSAIQYAAIEPPSPIPMFTQTIQAGHALWSNRTTAATGSPVTIPPYDESQFPVNQAVPTALDEDPDYALRTHFQRTWTLSPAVNQLSVDNRVDLVAMGWPRHRLSRTVRIKRRFTDTQGLYFSFWNATPVGYVGMPFPNVEWYVTGSLWYRMVW